MDNSTRDDDSTRTSESETRPENEVMEDAFKTSDRRGYPKTLSKFQPWKNQGWEPTAQQTPGQQFRQIMVNLKVKGWDFLKFVGTGSGWSVFEKFKIW